MVEQEKGGDHNKNSRKGKRINADAKDEMDEVVDEEVQNGKEAANTANSLYQKHKIAQAKSILQPFLLRRLKSEVGIIEKIK